MITFTARLLRFEEKGEKTGWTYLEIPTDVSEELKPGCRKSFRVKGQLDHYPIRLVALIPMGQGTFILPVNADMRKSIHKEEGASVQVALETDDDPLPQSADLLLCLEDEPTALAFFNQLTPSHQRYFSQWIESAKTSQTKASRIAKAIRGLAMGMDYGEMIRYFKSLNQ